MPSFDSISIYALLNNAWTDLSADAIRGFSARWGIFGYSPSDIIADIGDLNFVLKNSTGKYYPDGSSPLAGWGAGVKIKAIFTYGGIPYNRFTGYIPRDGIKLRVGKVSNESLIDVTAVDWMKFATETPIAPPDVQENTTADAALDFLMAYMPIQASIDADAGTQTFPTIFDGIGKYTTAYSEFARLTYSESPGRIYLIKWRDSGQVLIFENSTARDTPTQKSTYTLASHEWKNHSSGLWKNHSSGYWKNHTVTQSDAAVVTLNSDIDDVDPFYGSSVINRVTVTANPKRTDDELQVLYRLPYPIAIANGETKTIKARYVDPSGGGTRVNAIVSSMQTPEVPGDPDPYMMLLLHFTTDMTDSTGRHTVTANDVTIETDAYLDVGPEPDIYRINGNILGPYAIFGGYANYNLSVPSSDDFEFGSGAFTIGWYENLLDAAANDATLARDGTTTYAPWVLGYSDGTNKLIYMSSNGSSWDIADGKSFGQIQKARWAHYEIGRDDDGWFYAFLDGELTDKWYSSAAFPANSNPLSIGKTQGANYTFMGFDELYIKKGQCLHKTDFNPPRRNLSATLDGDYLLNANDNGTGADLSSGLSVSVEYSPDVVSYTAITNNSGSDGYLIHLQARGRGIYSYDTIDETVQNAGSIQDNGYQELYINQYYQQDLDAGLTWITAIVAAEKSPRTVLQSISFWANRSANNMLRFLQCDVGDLIRVVLSDPGIDNYYHIQNVSYRVRPGNLVYVTWGLVEGNTP